MDRPKFQLVKWYLDFVGNNGEAMIFYAAKLTWHGITVPYTSWLYRNTDNVISVRSRFRNIHLPKKNGKGISWKDPKFGICGRWVSRANPLISQLFESDRGNLDWFCNQPASQVELQFGNEILKGSGYVEKLVMTTLPWHIPMNELRWGRYISEEDHIVWIEIKDQEKKQWLWLNGDRKHRVIIEDSYISIPEEGMILKLDKGVVLESEKTIQHVVEKMVPLIPAFKRFMPLHFLMADNYKWLSDGVLHKTNQSPSTGTAIHECVYFKNDIG